MEYKEITVAEYLFTRCRLLGKPYNSNRINALPGDFALSLFHGALKAGMDYVSCANEQETAAAASGDARWYNYGFLLVTYGVGMKNIIGYISMDKTEDVRTLYISGAADPLEHGKSGVFNPGQKQLVHHYEESLKAGEHSSQYKAISQMGIPSAYIHDPDTAMEQIDRVLEGMEKFSGPGYLEVTRGVSKAIIKVPCNKLVSYDHYWDKSETKELISSFIMYNQDKIQHTVDIINKSKKPVLVIGSQVRRYGLKKLVQEIANKTGATVTSTQLGIGIFSDSDPQYAGVYAGGMSSTTEIKQAVEESDCIIAVGVTERETNSGLFTAKIDPKKLISINHLSIHVNGWKLETESFWDNYGFKTDTASYIEFISFLNALSSSKLLKLKDEKFPTFADYIMTSYPKLNENEYAQKSLTIDLMINILNNHFITPEMRLASDFGDCALMASKLRMGKGIAASSVDGHMNTGFGFLFGSQPQKNENSARSLLLLGDGAANMDLGGFLTLSARNIKGATIIILYDNCYKTLYLIDKDCPDPNVYSLPEVNYEYMSQVAGFGESFKCSTAGEFRQALDYACSNEETNTLIIAELNKNDCSPPLKSLTSSAGKRFK